MAMTRAVSVMAINTKRSMFDAGQPAPFAVSADGEGCGRRSRTPAGEAMKRIPLASASTRAWNPGGRRCPAGLRRF